MGPTRMAGEGQAGPRWAGRAARQSTLREHNMALALARIVDAGAPVTRARVAADIGVTRATSSDLVDRLVAAGLVRELPPSPGDRAGRPGVPLAPAQRTVAGVGLEVAVDRLSACAVDLSGMLLTQREVEVDLRHSDPVSVLESLAKSASAVLADLTEAGVRVAGVCVALPGLVTQQGGLLRLAPNLDWHDVPVVDLLSRMPSLAGLPILVGNDADLAAAAESRARSRAEGTDPTEQSFLMVTGEVGIGGAVVLAGTPTQGLHGWSGEIGHMVCDPAGPLCSCGATGCLEQFAGTHAMLRGAGLSVEQPVEILRDAARAGHARARTALDLAAGALGRVAASVLNFIDVDLVVLGGAYAVLFDELAPGVQAELDRRVLLARWQPVRLEAARVEHRPALRGAALAALDVVLGDPSSWIDRLADEANTPGRAGGIRVSSS